MPVCEDCRNGIHKHLDVMRESMWSEAPLHQKLDAIDCKNNINRNSQCVCPEYIRIHKELIL